MENEENRGRIDKKASEDQLVPFFSSFLELSHYSLSFTHYWTQFFLGKLWHWIKKGKGGKGKEGARKEENDQEATAGFLEGIDLHVYFPY